jgi:hypothetical protein
LISSELLAFWLKTSTMTLVPRIARTIAPWKSSPGLTSRLASQQGSPRFSSAPQIAFAIWPAADEWLMKTCALMRDPNNGHPN